MPETPLRSRALEEAEEWRLYWRLRAEEAGRDREALEEENATLATRLIERQDLIISLLLSR